MSGTWRPSVQYHDKWEYVVCGVIVGRASLHWNGMLWYSEISIIDPHFQFTVTANGLADSLAKAQEEVETYWSTHDMSHLVPEATQLSMF